MTRVTSLVVYRKVTRISASTSTETSRTQHSKLSLVKFIAGTDVSVSGDSLDKFIQLSKSKTLEEEFATLRKMIDEDETHHKRLSTEGNNKNRYSDILPCNMATLNSRQRQPCQNRRQQLSRLHKCFAN